ncbi:LytTR family DNA-binding domain-containing protein [Tissierella sp. Yu-01]|uniref:LytR/AlgR family response regulator transcription factor n=1 Tax=Tissierella sp. Yu-01 TaxID=3035694 RepID=UPI00240DC3AA|nr:LytTR family DNA-binding domain-containing protein [Tissierella sp. Yu-01]WFA09985.1 LytTR family DNA-binding domain-containing protein [Tissierella sp. Yu-01]
MANVMIVEDENNIAAGLKSIIMSIRDDIDVFITGYAKEALDESHKIPYDLFLLDIQLLDYSGFELAKEIRKIDNYKLTPIVFITAVPTKELMAFKQIHCYDYIIKPFNEKDVTEALSTIINYGIKKEEYMSFNLKNYIYRVKIDDIIYFEVIQRRIKVVTVNEQFYLSHYTLKKLENELTSNFIRCHKGFIVNVNYISCIDKSNNYINLDGTEDIIPMGRKYKDNLGGEVYESI